MGRQNTNTKTCCHLPQLQYKTAGGGMYQATINVQRKLLIKTAQSVVVSPATIAIEACRQRRRVMAD